jgi:hypothetical protein
MRIASSKLRATWPLYLEKAIAKVLGGYFAVDIANDPVLAYSMLTGFPTS